MRDGFLSINSLIAFLVKSVVTTGRRAAPFLDFGLFRNNESITLQRPPNRSVADIMYLPTP